MKIRLIPMIFLFLTFSTHSDSRGFESLVLDRPDGSKINYYLLKASYESPSDVLLLVLQGSGCNSVLKIESIFSDYRYVWPEADLLLIEKYGIDKALTYSSDPEREDCPIQYLQKDSPNQRLIDIEKVLNDVRKNRAYSEVIVMGGSEGAVIANLFASGTDDVDATISFNGGGRRFIDDVLHNIASAHEGNEEENESINGFKGFSEHILNSEPFDLQVSGHGYTWWRQMLSVDQYDVLRRVNSPLLIVQGGIDLSVSPEKVNEMVAALKESGKENIGYLVYENLDHGFNNSKGQSERKRVVSDLNKWLKKTLHRNPNKRMQPTADVSAD